MAPGGPGRRQCVPSSELHLPVWLLSPACGCLEALRDFLVAFFCGLPVFSVASAFLGRPALPALPFPTTACACCWPSGGVLLGYHATTAAGSVTFSLQAERGIGGVGSCVYVGVQIEMGDGQRGLIGVKQGTVTGAPPPPGSSLARLPSAWSFLSV